MEFKPPGYDQHKHHNQHYHMPFPSSSSSYAYFSHQAMKVGLPSGASVGGSLIGLEVLRRPVDMREIIQCDLDKERIREHIIAREIERKRILEEEVRRELMIEREMMHYGSGFPSSSMAGPSHSHRLLHWQSIPPEDGRIQMPSTEMYGIGYHRDFRGFEAVVPLHRSPTIQEITTPSPPEENTDVFIGLGMPHGSKRKPPPSDLDSNHSKKTRKEEYSCAICKISATSEHDFNTHLAGKKHQAKMTALRPQDRSKTIIKKSTKCVKFERKKVNETWNRKGEAEIRKSGRKSKNMGRKQNLSSMICKV